MKHIILDLGGVLIQLDWERRVSNLLGKDFDRQAVLQLWHDSKTVNDLETGKISFDDFAEHFKREFEINSSIDTIKAEFIQFVQDAYPGVDDLLSTIKKQGYGLSLLSNTSAPHFDYLYERNAFFSHFDQLFLSYKVGIMKPAAAIYQHVIAQLTCKPGDCYFFDDGKQNVAAAQAVGMQAYQVNSPQDVADYLADINL